MMGIMFLILLLAVIAAWGWIQWFRAYVFFMTLLVYVQSIECKPSRDDIRSCHKRALEMIVSKQWREELRKGKRQ